MKKLFKGEDILAETDLTHNLGCANPDGGLLSSANGSDQVADEFTPWETLIALETNGGIGNGTNGVMSSSSSDGGITSSMTSTAACCSSSAGVWLIAPLITRLPDQCQVKVIEQASKQLQDLGKAFWAAKNKSDKELLAIKNIFVWNQQPFFSLLTACLKSKDDQQRPLLNSLFYGLMDFITVSVFFLSSLHYLELFICLLSENHLIFFISIC